METREVMSVVPVEMRELEDLLMSNGYRLVKVQDVPMEEVGFEMTPVGGREMVEREMREARRREELAELEAAADAELVKELKKWRRERAKEEGVPLYIVMNNKTLLQIALQAPADRDELLLVPGFGPSKADKYGSEILDIVARMCEELPE